MGLIEAEIHRIFHLLLKIYGSADTSPAIKQEVQWIMRDTAALRLHLHKCRHDQFLYAEKLDRIIEELKRKIPREL